MNKTTYPQKIRRTEDKQCYFCTNDVGAIDYKDTTLLKNFLAHQYKIAARKRTGTCAKHQRRLSNAIKRSRLAALLPFTQHRR